MADTTPDLIGCDVDDCRATFVHVPARRFPNLCLDHASELAREIGHGWTPYDSVD